MMTKEKIAEALEEIGTLLELKDENPFKIRAYQNAARSIEAFGASFSDLQNQETLEKIPGVGKAIAGKVIELLEKGTFDAWERLTAETPESVLDLTEVPGIGPKTAALLHQRFKVSSLADLKTFVASGGLDMVDGIGPKTAEKIKEALE